MNILITNDDGIHAPGLKALESALKSSGHNLITLAPAEQHSECSHKINTSKDIKVKAEGHQRQSISGSPADCVRIGLHTLNKIDLVCSGINSGGNLGVDIYYSGTVAAAREACFHDIPSISFSNYLKRDKGIAWEKASTLIEKNLEMLLANTSSQHILNVNFPWDLSNSTNLNWVEAPLEKSPLTLDFTNQKDTYNYKGDYPNRQRTKGTDVDICFSGEISYTKIPLL